MKIKKRDYAGLSLPIMAISFIILILIVLINGFDNFLIIGILAVIFFISTALFFGAVIIDQFKNKKHIWGIINSILIIFWLVATQEYWEKIDIPSYIFVIAFISCLWYYFAYIRPKFKKKK